MAILKNPNDPRVYIQSAIDNNSQLNPITDLDLFINGGSDPFFAITLNETDWNQLYPYQLRIVDASAGHKLVNNYSFTLPIPPQELEINMPFAINVQPTFDGISEEHSGAPFRMINLSGSTGITPLKNKAFGPQNINTTQSILAGTLNATNKVARQINSLVNNTSTMTNLQNSIDIGLNPDAIQAKSTGYYQFHLLKKFLEYYSFAKKITDGKDYRLAFCEFKSQEMYLVTPLSFSVKRGVDSPLEYKYTLQLKAWRRLPIDGNIASLQNNYSTRDPNILAKVLNKVTQARSALQDLKDIVTGFNQDIDNVLFEPLRTTALFLKDALGVAATAADLPNNIVKDFKATVIDSWQSLANNIDLHKNTVFDGNELKNLFNNSNVTQANAGWADPASTANSNKINTTKTALSNSDPLNKVFEDPDKYHILFEQITPTSLTLSQNTIDAIENEKERVRKLTRLDFENQRISIQKLADSICDTLGLASDTYNRTYNRNTIVGTKTPTPDDYDVLFYLNQTAIALDHLAASYNINDVHTLLPTAIDYVATAAFNAGINFTKPISKFAIPVPYGVTLERLAAQYLGDPNRWMEIVTLNNLRDPYIDEEGFDLLLLNNGNGNNILVSDASDLYINQYVYVYSTTVGPSRRHITNIQKISDTEFLITLDGSSNLGNYTTLANARLHAYLPGTVNSQNIIYIPSQTTADEDPKLKSIPGVNNADGLLYVGGIDLLLNQSGDLIITPDGNSRLAFGLSNLVQSAKLAIGTPKGSLLQHPDYGFGVNPGINTSEADVKDMLKSAITLFQNDPRFSKVLGATISKNGPTLTISLSVQVSGTNHLLPITVEVQGQ